MQSDEKNFAHALVRRIKAENLLDTISAVTNTKDKFDGLPVGARAVQIADGTRSTYFLKTFGRATRETPCSCEVKMEPTLVAGPALAEWRNGQRQDPPGRVDREALREQEAAGRADHRAVRPLFRSQAGPARSSPSSSPLITAAKDQPQALEDVFWALLNSREFLFNH